MIKQSTSVQKYPSRSGFAKKIGSHLGRDGKPKPKVWYFLHVDQREACRRADWLKTEWRRLRALGHKVWPKGFAPPWSNLALPVTSGPTPWLSASSVSPPSAPPQEATGAVPSRTVRLPVARVRSGTSHDRGSLDDGTRRSAAHLAQTPLLGQQADLLANPVPLGIEFGQFRRELGLSGLDAYPPVHQCAAVAALPLPFGEHAEVHPALTDRAHRLELAGLTMACLDRRECPLLHPARLNVADCRETLKTIVEFPDAYRSQDDLLKLLGETQSAIRAGMTACGAVPRWIDGDQQDVFTWCRDEGDARRVFNVFLSLDRLADPSLSGGMLARVRKIREDLQESARSEKQRHRGLNTIRYHVGQIEDADEGSDHHWNRIAEGIGQVLRSGAAASNPELVEAIVPVADDVPESFLDRPGVRDVLRYVDQRLAADEVRQQQFPLTTRATTPEVLRVREALRGSRMVLIGGESRPHSRDLLEREFELSELDWQDSREHQSITAFEASVARPETRLVVLMIRWSSHSFEGVQEVCERNGKVFVRLPGGYNPSQVARQIVAQASEQLGIPASAS